MRRSGLFFFLCALLISSPACGAKEKIIFRSLVPTLEPLPPPRVLKGSVMESVATPPPQVNVFGYADGGGYPTDVTYVAPDSVAARAGLARGDKILSAGLKDLKATLIVQRGGKKYSCALNGKVEKGESKPLADYAIAMVVDSSASMGTKDCPGAISRWQWCQDHIGELYSQQSGVQQRNSSIVTFDSNFHSKQNCSPADLKSVFAGQSPLGETVMAPALNEAFLLVRRQLESGKPAIVSVISDGRPSDVDNVKKVIINETKSLSKPQLLTVVFIEVGTPEKYLQELDNDLVKQGASADIVKVIPFSQAQGQGLSKTLAAVAPVVNLPPSTTISGGVATSGPNKAQEAISSHIFTFNPNAGTRHTLQMTARPPVKASPAVVHSAPRPVAPPPIKAHPAGVSAEATATAGKIQEIDEKASALRGGANRTYK